MAKAPPLEKDIEMEDDISEDASEVSGESEGAGSAETAVPPKKSKKKIIILGVVGLLLIIGGIGGAYYGGLFGGSSHKEEVELGEDGLPLNKPVFFTMPDFLINLNASGRQTSFLKATIVLELASEGDVKNVEANMPRLLDAYNTYMRELRASDLVGSAGIQRLREELLLRANKTMAPVKINDVLFKEIIVQ
jgi:flagellar protein FliL